MTGRAEIIGTESVTKRFGALRVDKVDYLLRENEVAGIIGSNGAGKTTFFNLLTGYYPPDEGIIRFRGEDATRMTPQERVAKGMMRTFQLTSTFDNPSGRQSGLAFSCAQEGDADAAAVQHLQGHVVKKNFAGVETFNLGTCDKGQASQPGWRRRDYVAVWPAQGAAGWATRRACQIGFRGLGVLRALGSQTILIVEHKISHVQDFLERLTVMHEGRVIADGGCEECLRHPEVRRSYWQIDVTAEASGVFVS
jgi:branched-chain amino acid transport system ATP-binding protein